MELWRAAGSSLPFSHTKENVSASELSPSLSPLPPIPWQPLPATLSPAGVALKYLAGTVA